MAKMNLEFLLSPEKDNNASGGNESTHRSSRNEFHRPEACSPLSLDYIAPRPSDSSTRLSVPSIRQPSRRLESSSSTHLRLNDHTHIISTSPTRNSTRDQGTTSRFKGKKTKNPNAPGSEVKPHVCPACDRSFYKLEQLKRHDRLVHLNLRPFVCKTCELSFGTKQNMQVHLTTRKHQHRLETLQGGHRSNHGSSSRQHPWPMTILSPLTTFISSKLLLLRYSFQFRTTFLL